MSPVGPRRTLGAFYHVQNDIDITPTSYVFDIWFLYIYTHTYIIYIYIYNITKLRMSSLLFKQDIIQRAGVVEVLVRSMTSHATTEHLLSEGLAVLDELHGLQALLQALEHLRSSPAASKAALITFRASVPFANPMFFFVE